MVVDLSGVLAVETDGETHERVLAPGIATTVGRGTVWAGMNQPWVPRELLVLKPSSQGWVAHLRRGPAQVDADFMRGTAQAGAQILLHRGAWRLSWSGLKHPLSVLVTVSVAHRPLAPRGRAAHQDVLGGGVSRTEVPRSVVRGDHVARLARVFAPAIEGRPMPHDHIGKVAAEFALTPQQLRNWLHKRRLSAERQLAREGTPRTFSSLAEFGTWLVETGHLSAVHLED